MPNGVPVATVALNAAKNAGILAASILGSSNSEIYQTVAKYKEDMKKSVEEKANRVKKQG